MSDNREAVTRKRVASLRRLARWAADSIDEPGQLHGQREFRRRWSQYGPENTIAVTELWDGTRSEHDEAKNAAARARTQMEPLERLDHDELSSITAPARGFPLLRARLSDGEQAARETDQRLKQVQHHADEALEERRAELSHLENVLVSRTNELQNLRKVVASEQEELDNLRSQNDRLATKRTRLQNLVDALDEQIGR